MGNCCSGEEAQETQSSHQLQQWDPINYVVPEDRKAILARGLIVTQVNLVAQTVLQSGGNHWTMFLQTGPESAVRIDMEPGAWPGSNGYLGRLDIVRRNHVVSRNRQTVLSIRARPGVTAADFLSTIINSDSHRYEFTQAGRGCTGWMRDQFYLFVQQGLLEAGYEEQVEYALNHEWRRDRAVRSWPLTQGTYLRDRGARRRRR